MQTSDIISTISLIVSIVGIPISYYLGGRNSRNSTYNNAIDELEKLCQKTFDDAMKIEKSTAKNESVQKAAIRNLIYKLVALTEFYEKKFY